MKKTRKKTTKTGLLVTIILFLAAALFIQAGFILISPAESSQEEYTYWDQPLDSPDYRDSSLEIVGYGATSSPIDAMSSTQLAPAPIQPATKSSASEPNQDLTNANSLVAALLRIVRSGQSMDALRNTNNSVLKQRCYDGMQKLQSEALEIRSRRINIALPSASTSLSKVFNNIMKCVSCDGNARGYCQLAQTDLNEMSRSLSIN